MKRSQEVLRKQEKGLWSNEYGCLGLCTSLLNTENAGRIMNFNGLMGLKKVPDRIMGMNSQMLFDGLILPEDLFAGTDNSVYGILFQRFVLNEKMFDSPSFGVWSATIKMQSKNPLI